MRRWKNLMRIYVQILLVSLLIQPLSVNSQTTQFDGDWRATMTCPPHNSSDDDAKGYTHILVGQVVSGQLRMTPT